MSATAAMTSASQNAPRPGPRTSCIVFSPPPRNEYLTDGCGFGRPPLLRDVSGDRPAPSGRRTLPQPDEAVRRDQDDDQEDHADEGVKAVPDDAHVGRVVVQDDEHERAEPGAL